ncbi:hypothetical protein ABZ805_27585, partial [Saccharopolyspora sp. NPDC047091]|uniref:hypothetical protein n=1 Tax=Saccharopolyspora sp. NPDC047091 TaxID=3155924 RepID=UPI00340D381F
DVLTGRTSGVDQIVLRRGRVVVLNRMPICSPDCGDRDRPRRGRLSRVIPAARPGYRRTVNTNDDGGTPVLVAVTGAPGAASRAVLDIHPNDHTRA